MKNLFFTAILLLILSSCGSRKPLVLDMDEMSCYLYNKSSSEKLQPIQPEILTENDSILNNDFSSTSLKIAKTIGITKDLKSYVVLKNTDRNSENNLERLELSHKILQKINLATLQVASVSAEMDCEEKRLKQLGDFMKREEADRESTLTVGAIAVGAVGATVSGFLIVEGKQGNSLDYIGVGAGIAEALFGTMILLNNRKAKITHHRNVLKEIWEGKNNMSILPAFVWFYLEHKTDNKLLTYRDQIIEHWKKYEQVAPENTKDYEKFVHLFFGEGGRYTTDQVYNRAQMYDQLEVTIKLIDQDLTTLAGEFMQLENR